MREKLEKFTQMFLNDYIMQTCDAINNLGKGKANMIDFNPITKKYEIISRFVTPEERKQFDVNTIFKNFDKAVADVEKIVRDVRELIRDKISE